MERPVRPLVSGSEVRFRLEAADDQDRAQTRGRTVIGYLALGAFRSAEKSAFEEKLGWWEIHPGWTVPQGSQEFLRTPHSVRSSV